MATNKFNRPGPPQLDMNPMVDMAFLLVTFFLLATSFKNLEPTRIILPRSISKTELPDKEVIQITMNRNGDVFFGLENQGSRTALLERFADAYGVELTAADKHIFSLLPGIGVPAAELLGFLRLTPEERQHRRQPGIPRSEGGNELEDWIILARTLQPRARVAIKADRETPYKHVDAIIKTLIKNNVLRFHLITEIRRADGI
ncbi:MAG TPA: biopolymer transporter ExbD [Lacibacter sp.]|nr:biopolymer transporter ExbD [Lacibacter sp.]HMO88378.1 biopolymer transporter ExbD [Lacibacter sp.]HMP86362.1 biopolymer transporter ExbD [Lacibacter sp.]